MSLCISCGAENVEHAQFCTKCGATVSGSSSPGGYEPPFVSASTPVTGTTPGGQPSYAGNVSGVSSQYGPASDPGRGYQPGAAVYSPQYASAQQSQAGIKADPILRLGAWLIDGLALLVLLIPVIVVGLIPFIGWIIAFLGIPVIIVSYHLLRDIKAQSPGKFLLGMKVVGIDGREAPNQSRVLRNVLFAIPPLFFILPIIGHIIGGFLMTALVLTEGITLLATGDRIGDRIGKTMVVKIK